MNTVYYEDFGAKGDGKTNDYQAFYDAHKYANENGLSVKAQGGKTYMLSDPTVTDGGERAVRSIVIKTDTDWTDAEFIIDDRSINGRDREGDGYKISQTWVFTVASDYEKFTVTKDSEDYKEKFAAIGSVGCTYGTKRLDLGLGYPALLIIYDENKGVYRRSGDSYAGQRQQTFGSAQHEFIIVDKDGIIDGSTPFMFDYDALTKIEVIRLDIKPITIRGGTFTTRSCLVCGRITVDGKNSDLPYYARGLKINRSFTTVDRVDHYIADEFTVDEYVEGKRTARYTGFYFAAEAANVLFCDCIMTGRKNHLGGTYEFNANGIANLTLLRCKQSNFWVDERGDGAKCDTGVGSMDKIALPDGGSMTCCFGMCGTNFCKNLSFVDSRISRFDAHQGLYNGSIINSEIQYIEIIGKGRFTLKDTRIYIPTGYGVNSLFYLRGDYGCTWEGEINVENVTAYINDAPFYIFLHGFSNFDYGYRCHIPNISLDGLRIALKTTREDVGADYPSINIYTAERSMQKQPYMHLSPMPDGTPNNNPIAPPEYVKVSKNAGGYKYRVPFQTDGQFLSAVKFYSDGIETDYGLGEKGAFMFY